MLQNVEPYGRLYKGVVYKAVKPVSKWLVPVDERDRFYFRRNH